MLTSQQLYTKMTLTLLSSDHFIVFFFFVRDSDQFALDVFFLSFHLLSWRRHLHQHIFNLHATLRWLGVE